jgi:hydrogenase maturation factor
LEEPGCITCADAAEPMRVIEVEAGAALASCEDGGGRRRTVDIGILADVRPGDAVLVHAGTALHHEPA